MILPGATIGVLGGGQLGRMFTMAAHTLGYRVMVLDPDPHSPAGQLADEHLQADYKNTAVLQQMGNQCAAITTEWENVPATTLEILASYCPVQPNAEAVAIARDRILEKSYIRDHGLSTAPFFPIHAIKDLAPAIEGLQLPALLKTATLGYDGKGQRNVIDLDSAITAFEQLGSVPCVLEEKVQLKQELSVVLARGMDGKTAVYPVGENVHRNGILHTTLVPGRIEKSISNQAIGMACSLIDAMNYVGVVAVEFFLTQDEQLLINEMAPRPHNSGHYTLDATVTSQFEQQVRALCGLPLGDTRLLSPVVMLNLLGDAWHNGQPNWDTVFHNPAACLHLYGKKEARPGRKMGHINVLAEDAGLALQQVEDIFKTLSPN